MFPWQPILGAKSAKLAYPPSFVDLEFRKGLDHCNVDFKCDDPATSCKNFVKFDPVTPTPLVDQQFGFVPLVAPLRDLAGISTEFSVAFSTQLCFTTIR